jgi:hypothetical protein
LQNKKRDKREIDNFINTLACTLNAANINVSRVELDVEDLKDEVLDDLEEEVLQAEMGVDEDRFNAGGGRLQQQPVNRRANMNNSRNNDDEDVVMVKNPISRGDSASRNNSRESKVTRSYGGGGGYDESSDGAGSSDLGATNHMQSRINSLEK